MRIQEADFVKDILFENGRLKKIEERLSSFLSSDQKQVAKIAGISDAEYAIQLLDCYQRGDVASPEFYRKVNQRGY